jgi:hypothetical protein
MKIRAAGEYTQISEIRRQPGPRTSEAIGTAHFAVTRLSSVVLAVVKLNAESPAQRASGECRKLPFIYGPF